MQQYLNGGSLLRGVLAIESVIESWILDDSDSRAAIISVFVC